MQLNQSRLLDLFAQNFVVQRSQISFEYARASLLVLRKNLRRSRVLLNCMDTA
jgi:hypothetical protein